MLWFALILVTISGCTDVVPLADSVSVPSDGIAVGIFAPMGEPMPRATPEQLVWFERGKEVAQRAMAPADGLGPSFNAVS